MLLEFKAKNYKSFLDGFTFSMIPAPKQKGLDYSILKKKIGRKHYKALSSAIVYGANASGKSNIISAMDTFKSIILRSNIKDYKEITHHNSARCMLDLIPSNTLKQAQPIDFSIKFIADDLLIEYSISVDVGLFMQNSSRKIVAEELNINGNMVFLRKNNLSFGDFKNINKYTMESFNETKDSAQTIAKNNLNDEELFLMNGFKSMFSSNLVSIITDWIEHKFIVIYHSNYIMSAPMEIVSRANGGTIGIDDMLSKASNRFGLHSNELGYKFENDDKYPTLCSVFKSGSKAKAIPAEMFESYGTVRFANLFPIILTALLRGGILVIDEFDASIHPMAVMSIINIFHNDEINVNNAQLIFNTHNPIFLNSNLFRRDEIKFVERDDNTHISTHYSLSDFGTSGKDGVRKGEDYMNNYFQDRYGAIKDVDFSDLFEELIKNNGNNGL